MKKLLPKSLTLKRLSRRAIDTISAITVAVTVLSLFFLTYMTNAQDDCISDAGNFAIYKGNEEKDAAALMFNVYEGSDVVKEILSILQKYSAKATFFVGGVWAEKNREILLAISESGQEIGCHGYLHKDHSKLSLEQNKEEIAKTNHLVKEITGNTVTLFAPPSGAFCEETEKACRALVAAAAECLTDL